MRKHHGKWWSSGHVPRQEFSTGTSAPSASATPIFSFINEDDLQPSTCQAVDLYWFYAGSQGTINLYATNVGVPQPNPSISSPTVISAPPSATRNITVTLGININTSTSVFRWSPVNVPQGWYILNVSLPAQSLNTESDPFYVHTGNDTSCISSFLTSASSLNTPAPKPTSSILPTASTVATVSQSTALSIGTVIGATFGLAIVIGAILMTYIWCKRGRSSKTKRRHAKGGYPNRWKELGSADSRGALRDSQPRPYHQPSNNSMGTAIHSTQSDEGTGAEKSSMHSKLESSALSCEEDVALSTLPVLTHQSSRSRTFAVDRPQSLSSSTTLGLSSQGHSAMPERVPPVRDATSKRRSLDSVAYPPSRSPLSPTANSSPPNRDQRAFVQIPSTRHQDSRLSLQPGSQTTLDAEKQANRQSFGRKRKPVPVYDGEEPTLPSVPPNLPTSPVSQSSTPLEAIFSSSPSPGHYVTRHQSVQESGHSDQMHKGNLGPGDKQLHYLIPDMPMSQ